MNSLKFILFFGSALLVLFGSTSYVYAEDEPAYCRVGQAITQPPPSSSNEVASNAEQLVQTIVTSCGNHVTANNYTCAQNAVTFLPNAAGAYGYIKSSSTNNDYLQCVGFVQAVLTGLNMELSVYQNAYLYSINIPAGWQLLSRGVKILPGDLLVTNDNDRSAGHIAVVVRVYDDTHIQLAEANIDMRGRVGLRNTVTSEIGVKGGFLRKT